MQFQIPDAHKVSKGIGVPQGLLYIEQSVYSDPVPNHFSESGPNEN
jgi:hypothetical protein